MYHSLGRLDICFIIGKGIGLLLCIAHVDLDRIVSRLDF